MPFTSKYIEISYSFGNFHEMLSFSLISAKLVLCWAKLVHKDA